MEPMKYILLALLFFPIISLADEVTCFSKKGKVIYHNQIKNIQTLEMLLIFNEKKSGVLVLTNSDCIIKIS